MKCPQNTMFRILTPLPSDPNSTLTLTSNSHNFAQRIRTRYHQAPTMPVILKQNRQPQSRRKKSPTSESAKRKEKQQQQRLLQKPDF